MNDRCRTLLLALAVGALVLGLACSPVEPSRAARHGETKIWEMAQDVQLRRHAQAGAWAALDTRGAVLTSGPEAAVRLSMAARMAVDRLYTSASAADTVPVWVLRLMTLPLSGHHWMATARGPDPRCEVSMDAPQEEIDAYFECVRRAAADPECEVMVQEWFKRERKLHTHCELARR